MSSSLMPSPNFQHNSTFFLVILHFHYQPLNPLGHCSQHAFNLNYVPCNSFHPLFIPLITKTPLTNYHYALLIFQYTHISTPCKTLQLSNANISNKLVRFALKILLFLSKQRLQTVNFNAMTHNHNFLVLPSSKWATFED